MIHQLRVLLEATEDDLLLRRGQRRLHRLGDELSHLRA
eukprot:CAMPEP_0115767810 /NCGR_PEP_ID=MMETSP0272-20121206/103865_1 /TAXON_ID=71861 /ORGANISM="Scrippsiella trochoidea, Strain CCMP3099" /LENGTH=37 /DNA_ID= /DNA_START= /DNA_END= /DNA_ORIENTATION=